MLLSVAAAAMLGTVLLLTRGFGRDDISLIFKTYRGRKIKKCSRQSMLLSVAAAARLGTVVLLTRGFGRDDISLIF